MLEVADTGNSITGMKGDVSACIDRLRYFAGLGYELQGTYDSRKLGQAQHHTPGAVWRRRQDRRLQPPDRNGGPWRGLAADGGQCGGRQAFRAMPPVGDAAWARSPREVLPPGVLNVVTGDGEVGSALVRHPRVKRLSFVGSVRTGMAIQRSAAEVAVKSISLELGGKNPFIVFPDAPRREGRRGGGGWA